MFVIRIFLHKLLLLFILFMLSFSSYSNDGNECQGDFSKGITAEPAKTPHMGKKSKRNHLTLTMDNFVDGMVSLLNIISALDATIKDYYTFNPEIHAIFAKTKRLTYVGDLIQMTRENLIALGIPKKSVDLIEKEILSKNINCCFGIKSSKNITPSLGMQLEESWTRPNPFSQEVQAKENRQIDSKTQLDITTEEMMVLGRIFGVIGTTAVQQDFLSVLNHHNIHSYRALLNKIDKDHEHIIDGGPIDDFQMAYTGGRAKLASLCAMYIHRRKNTLPPLPKA